MCGQGCQNPPDFVAFGDLGFAKGIIELDHRQRLNKQGRPGGRLVMYDRLDLSLELCPQRDDVSSIALGDHRVLQLGGCGAVGQVALKTRHQAVMGNPHLPSEVIQLGGGAVSNFSVVGDTAGDGFDQSGWRWQAGCNVSQVWICLGVFIKETVKVTHRDQRGLHIQQFLWVEHAAVLCEIHLFPDIVGTPDGQVAGDEQRSCLAGPCQADKRCFVVWSRLQSARQVC